MEKVVSAPVSRTADFPVVLFRDTDLEAGVGVRGGELGGAEGKQ